MEVAIILLAIGEIYLFLLHYSLSKTLAKAFREIASIIEKEQEK